MILLVLLQLDMQSLLSLQRTNHQLYDTVHEVPYLKAILQHSPNVLQGILSTEQLRSFNANSSSTSSPPLYVNHAATSPATYTSIHTGGWERAAPV
jgi:hypothetical protein